MIFCALYCMCIILYQYSFFIICMHYKVHVTYIMYPMYKLYVTFFIWHFLLYIYIPHSSYGISCYIYIPHSSYGISYCVYIPYYTHNIPHFSHHKQHKKPGTQMSTRAIHLLLCVLYKLRFTECAKQSNLLQCLCNTEKDN